MKFPAKSRILLLAIFLCSGCSYSFLAASEIEQSAQKNQAPELPVSSPIAARVFTSQPEQAISRASAENPADFGKIYQGQTLSEDCTWNGKVLVRGTLTIAPQATLTIGPGAEVVFVADPDSSRAGGLLVRGRLAVLGTAEQPVHFMPGGNRAEPGLWQGIVLLGSEKSNVLEHAVIEGADTGIESIASSISLKEVDVARCKTAARFQDSFVRAVGGKVSACDIGHVLIDCEADLRSMTFSEHVTALLLYGGSLYLEGAELSRNSDALQAEHAKLRVSRSRLANNRTGITLSDCEGTVELSTIVENYEYGILLQQSLIRVTANRISRNTGVGITVDGGRSSAWGNSFSHNGLYDLYNQGIDDFRAIGNWWHATREADIRKRIFDRTDDSKRGKIYILPFLPKDPDAGTITRQDSGK